MKKLLFLLSVLAVSQARGQSLADVARQQRDKSCKAGRVQFCDKESDSTQIGQWHPGISSFEPSQLPAAPSTPSVHELQKGIDDIKSLNERQLGIRYVGDIHWPDRPKWEEKLAVARDKLVAALQYALDVSGSSQLVVDRAKVLLRDAQWDFDAVKSDGVAAAADWERKTKRWTPAHCAVFGILILSLPGL